MVHEYTTNHNNHNNNTCSRHKLDKVIRNRALDDDESMIEDGNDHQVLVEESVESDLEDGNND